MRWQVGIANKSPLARRLTVLTALRLLVLAAFLGLTERVYFSGSGWGSPSGLVALVTIGASFVISGVYAVLLRRGRLLRPVSHMQLVTDQITWTAIAYISGGVTSGAVSLYGLTCLSGAITTYRTGALTAAVSGVTFYLGLCAGFATGLIQPPIDQSASAYIVDGELMVYPALSAVMTTMVVALLAAYLADRLRTYGGKLRDAELRAERAERLAAMGRLAAALAHEIRNPLGSIRGSVELLRTGGSLNEEDVQLCRIVEREVARLDGLVGDMTHLGRPRVPEMAQMDLAKTIAAVVTLARTSSRGEEVAVEYEGPPELPIVADGAQLKQLLWNLVRNAMQSSERGGRVQVRLTSSPSGAALVEVEDRGVGIPQQDQAKIFDPFYSSRSHGMGIGLAVVKQVADSHGYELELRSAPKQGTTFGVRLPRSARAVTGVALLLGALGCTPTQSWSDPGAIPGDVGTLDDGWTGTSTSTRTGDLAPEASSPTSARPQSAVPTAASDGGAGSTAAVSIHAQGTGNGPAGGAEGATFRNTYYDFPREPARVAGMALETLYDADCKPIVQAARSFHDQLCVQGSGRLLSGTTVSFAKRDCPCAATCPRTDQKICFEALDPVRFPSGRGAMGTPITAERTVAVDPTVIALGTVLYIPDFHGLRNMHGQAHDGCFVAEDRGLRVKGHHVDVFTGDPELTRAWNTAVPSNKGVRVIVDAARCAHLKR